MPTNQKQVEIAPKNSLPSRSLKRIKLVKSKKMLRLSMLLLLVSLFCLVLLPMFEIRQIKSVTTGVKVTELVKAPSQSLLSMKPSSNQIELDDSNQSGYVAKLAIPSLHLYLPISQGAGVKNLKRGAALPVKSQGLESEHLILTSSLVLLNQDLLFGRLDKVGKNDLIFITDGVTLSEYQVTNTYQAKKIDDEIFTQEFSKPYLTMYVTGWDKTVVEARLNQSVNYITSDNYFKEIMNK